MKTFKLVSLCVLSMVSTSFAATTIYSLNMTGAQEVPGPGDPDGFATGTLTINDSTGGISWSFTYSNIAAPTAMHIHSGSAGVAGGVLVGLGVATSGGAGTLISSTTTTTANALSITSNPTAYYVNIHNTEFPGGAVRGQLGTVVPEPSSIMAGALGCLVLLRRRRQAAASAR